MTMSSGQCPPFNLKHQLTGDLDGPKSYVPGHPRVPLRFEAITDFLTRELCSDELDQVADRLWWMSTQNHANISPLHRQLVKRRTIIITEDPKLHLVWIQDRIFIKPLPKYLASYVFWNDYISGSDDDEGRSNRIRAWALGYFRTYYYLIKYESDFRIAQDPSLCLIPPGVTWEQFCNFTSGLVSIQDRDVSERYSYGEIRLTRLNFYAPFLLGKSHFQRVEYQYGAYFARFYGPILFFVAFLAIILSGLQVIASIQEDGKRGWVGTALGVSVTAIVMSCIILLILGLVWVYKVAKEWNFAIRERLRLSHESRALA